PSSTMMCPDDANIVGNVHGGTILKMIEEAGCIIGTRHCNTQNEDRCVAALVRVEKTEFLYPMFIGEVAHVSADITYASKHSVEVQVKVVAENILTGTKKLTNKAALWYVPVSLQNVDKIMEVPALKYDSPEQEEEGKKRYEAQKMERLETKERNEEVLPSVPNPEQHSVGFSQSSLIHLVGPSDCTLHDFVHGGVTMKLMDEVAGIVAVRHCNTNVVTASVDAINFHRKIKKGCVVTVTGRMTFTSNKSMEIEVFVDASPLLEPEKAKYRAVSAFFTFISLDKYNRPQPVPPLKVGTCFHKVCHIIKPGSMVYLNIHFSGCSHIGCNSESSYTKCDSHFDYPMRALWIGRVSYYTNGLCKISVSLSHHCDVRSHGLFKSLFHVFLLSHCLKNPAPLGELNWKSVFGKKKITNSLQILRRFPLLPRRNHKENSPTSLIA
uniref:palmitoyl-CoA hydrolase n=2 Tax=Myripristis murdjan TaxID=586833 RepID=A0A667Y024_9TELE